MDVESGHRWSIRRCKEGESTILGLQVLEEVEVYAARSLRELIN